MLSVLRHLLSKLVSPIWRTVDEVDEDGFFCGDHGTEDIRHLRGSVVTQLCTDYGMIDDAVYFTNEQLLGGLLLKEGDIVNATAVRDRAEGGWRALRVEKSADAWEDGGKASLEADTLRLQPLIGTVTSYDGDGGYINQTTYFSRYTLSEGYAPMKGDWVQAKYFVNPTDWTTRAHSVAPLRYCRLDQVPVTAVFGNSGVVDDSVFFCLDSLLLPTHYQPSPGHMVNLVMLESSQALYSWRALCMAPCLVSVNSLSELPSDTKTHIILENKEDLDVSDYGQQFGELVIGERRYLVLWIQNRGSETHRLIYCDFAGWDSEEQFYLVTLKGSTSQKRASTENCPESQSVLDFSEKQENNDKAQKAIDVPGVRREEMELNIPPGERVSVSVACEAKSLGICAEMLLLHFSSFTIGRRLEVTVGSEEVKRLQASVPYTPTDAQPILTTPTQVITTAAPKVARLSKRKMPHFLPKFAVPQALKDCVEAKGDVLVFQPLLGEVLSPSNMHARFSTLLWLEELHAERELQEFNISGALLRKGAAYLHLVVNGLAEGRPSLSIGDRIVLKKARSDGSVVEYISSVAEINDEEVSLRLNFEFQRNYLGEPLDVEFSYNRITMRRCHNALVQTKEFGDILFPSAVTLQTPQWSGKWIDEMDQNKPGEDAKPSGLDNENNVSSISVDMKSKATQTKDGRPQFKPLPSRGNFFNPELNPSQREAVKRILEGECRPIPYILFGPPGTGKTITLIEAILQVYHYVPSSRVLVCTPSNSAADLICVRLHDSGFLDCASLARVNASSRHIESIPDVLQRYSRAGEDIREASFHRIVVSTCSSAGMFHNLGIHVGHFTHVFLDEAGQATEPESLIPISLVSEKHGQIVLAGDPCQLGPVIKSKVATAFGLGVSLLERLMSSPLYSRHDWGYNPKLVTKLNYNYRSHEALLKLPSKLFYQEELYCKAPSAVVESLCQWKKLPQKGLPLLFHGVRGTEMREGNNPSWFNPVEAVQVMLYCCQLAKKLHRPVHASDIGIIAPYKKQCEKIRMLLAKVGLSDIKVGSVEEFQGQEFLVIIMSTVRSNESVQKEDLQSSLGFLANPKRFNVAITRSKALLLIVGNPHILVKDMCFRALLQYCFIKGAYLGCDPPPLLRESQIAEEDEK